jgi:hypothetical protein
MENPMSPTHPSRKPVLRPILVATAAGLSATATGLTAVAIPGVAEAAPDTAQTSSQPAAAAEAVVAASLGSDIANKAVAEYQGSHRFETPPGSNCNYYSQFFHDHGDGRPACEAWCADFAEYVWKAGQANVNGITAAAASFYGYGRSHGTWHASPSLTGVAQGDVVIYNLRSDGSYADHVGVVTSINGTTGAVNVVSGNYNDGVYKHNAHDAGVISGYIRPVHN